jgi:Tfp pilus assembly protein FimT
VNTNRRRRFTLLEVLIALVLITTALPLLTAPYFYESLNLMQATKARRLENDLKKAKALILESIHTKQLNPFTETRGEWKKVQTMPAADYLFTRVKPKPDDAEEKVELWELSLRIKDLKGEPLKYLMVVKR